uniref:Uncharacterized protein n=1 Tax=Manihot esculenta TaxID=3983 RepID=A0A2C9UV35_MANES
MGLPSPSLVLLSAAVLLWRVLSCGYCVACVFFFFASLYKLEAAQICSYCGYLAREGGGGSWSLRLRRQKGDVEKCTFTNSLLATLDLEQFSLSLVSSHQIWFACKASFY